MRRKQNMPLMQIFRNSISRMSFRRDKCQQAAGRLWGIIGS